MISIETFMNMSGVSVGRRRRRPASMGLRAEGIDAPSPCEALEVRVVMSAAPMVVAAATENSASDFTYHRWNSGIAISAYAGPGGIVRIPTTIDGLPVTTIVGLALGDRRDVTGVVLPTSVKEIYRAAFAGSGITSISIPASVTFMDQAFIYAESLQSINVHTANPAFSSVGGVLFNKAKTVLCEYPAGRAGPYEVPVGVQFMRTYAFAARNKLTAVTLPSTLLFVPEHGFAYCQKLREVRIAPGVTGVGQFAFRSCPSLTSVSLPTSVEFARYAFFDCPNLRVLGGAATAPSNVRVRPLTDGGVRLTWSRPLLADGSNLTLLHYHVEYSKDSGKTWRLAAQAPAAATQVTIPGLNGPRGYLFRVTPLMGLPYSEPYNTDATVRGQATTASFFASPRGWQRAETG